MPNTLNVHQTKDMFLYVADQVIENKPILTDIDSATGDGDHGIGMSIGFKEVIKDLHQDHWSTINDIFKTIGMSMIRSMGGASGVIFGTMFIGGIKNLNPLQTLSVESLAHIFERSLISVKQRGKAEVGDKTMIDAFQPAVISLRKSADGSKDLLTALIASEKSAKTGMENTKNYPAKVGRAKSLGERTIGYQDAGATSIYIIFKSMREWVERNQ